MFKRKPKEIHKIKLQKVRAEFKTADGELHKSYTYGWVNSSNLLCSVGEFIMIDIESKGYIEDNNGVMYPLTNVISINWNIINEKEIEDYSCLSFPKISYTDKDIEKLG